MHYVAEGEASPHDDVASINVARINVARIKSTGHHLNEITQMK